MTTHRALVTTYTVAASQQSADVASLPFNSVVLILYASIGLAKPLTITQTKYEHIFNYIHIISSSPEDDGDDG